MGALTKEKVYAVHASDSSVTQMAVLSNPFSTCAFGIVFPPHFSFSYFDQSVLNFMQKFQQNGLLENVNLLFNKLSPKDIVQPVLCHLLPMINSINSIEVSDSTKLVDIYDAGNNKEIYELNIKMIEETRLLAVR
jgi:hypothetical protein